MFSDPVEGLQCSAAVKYVQEMRITYIVQCIIMMTTCNFFLAQYNIHSMKGLQLTLHRKIPT